MLEAGPLSNSRIIESIGEMNTHFGYFLGKGPAVNHQIEHFKSADSFAELEMDQDRPDVLGLSERTTN